MARHVLVVSPNLSSLEQGAVYSAKELGMDDDQLDIFIAKGFGIEHDVKRRKTTATPRPATPAPVTESSDDDGERDSVPVRAEGLLAEDG